MGDMVYSEWPIPTQIRVRYPEQASHHILEALFQFNDLRPRADTFKFNDGIEFRGQFALHGTIPIVYKGNTYNIPVSLYLPISPKTYPYHPPRCYVRPTNDMMIKPSQHVDAQGKICLPYLSEWQYPKCDLVGLLQIMILVFQDSCPVFEKPPKNNSSSGEAFQFQHKQIQNSSYNIPSDAVPMPNAGYYYNNGPPQIHVPLRLETPKPTSTTVRGKHREAEKETNSSHGLTQADLAKVHSELIKYGIMKPNNDQFHSLSTLLQAVDEEIVESKHKKTAHRLFSELLLHLGHRNVWKNFKLSDCRTFPITKEKELQVFQDTIGVGGFAVVRNGLLLHEDGTFTPVAVKFFNSEDCDYERETQALRQLRHRNIVQMYNVFDFEDNPHFFTMEYVLGGTIERFWSEPNGKLFAETLDLKSKLCIAEQVWAGIKYLHERSVVHQDIKPNNILVSLTYEVKLCDFGMAELNEESIENSMTTRGRFGNSLYLAPEILVEGRRRSREADVWAAGLTLFQLFTGKYPFLNNDGQRCSEKELEKLFKQIRKMKATDPVELIANEWFRETQIKPEALTLPLKLDSRERSDAAGMEHIIWALVNNREPDYSVQEASESSHLDLESLAIQTVDNLDSVGLAMTEHHREKLRNLAKQNENSGNFIDPMNYVAPLRIHGLLTVAEMELVRNQKTAEERICMLLLDILPTKGDSAFTALGNIFIERGYVSAAELLYN